MGIQKMKELNKALEEARREKEIAMLAIEKRERETEKAKAEKTRKAEELKKVRWEDRDVAELMQADVGELLLPAITKLFSRKDGKWKQDVGETLRPAKVRIFPQIEKDTNSDDTEVKKIKSLVALQKAARTKAGMTTLLVFTPYITGVIIITMLCFLSIDVSFDTYVTIAKENFSAVGLWTIGYFTISSVFTLFFLHTIFYNFFVILTTKK